MYQAQVIYIKAQLPDPQPPSRDITHGNSGGSKMDLMAPA